MRVPSGEVPVLDSPGDDPLRADPDPRTLALDRLRASSDLDAARLPGIDADQLVDHDRGPSGAANVLELLRRGQVHPADIDRVMLGVESPAHRDDVGAAVLAYRRDAGEPLRSALREIRELAFREG